MDMAMLAEFDIAHIPETTKGTQRMESVALEQIAAINAHAKAMYDDPSVIKPFIPTTREEAGQLLRVMNQIRDGQRPDEADRDLYDELMKLGTTAVADAVAAEEKNLGQKPRECAKCGKTKARVLFPKNGAQCKQCRADYNRERYQRKQATKKATEEAVAAGVPLEVQVNQPQGVIKGKDMEVSGSIDLFINPSLNDLRRIAQLTHGDLNEAARLCDEIGELFT